MLDISLDESLRLLEQSEERLEGAGEESGSIRGKAANCWEPPCAAGEASRLWRGLVAGVGEGGEGRFSYVLSEGLPGGRSGARLETSLLEEEVNKLLGSLSVTEWRFSGGEEPPLKSGCASGRLGAGGSVSLLTSANLARLE